MRVEIKESYRHKEVGIEEIEHHINNCVMVTLHSLSVISLREDVEGIVIFLKIRIRWCYNLMNFWTHCRKATSALKDHSNPNILQSLVYFKRLQLD